MVSTLPIEDEGYMLNKQEFWASLISDMAGHYPEHQERVHVGTTLTSSMLLHAKKEDSLHSVTTD